MAATVHEASLRTRIFQGAGFAILVAALRVVSGFALRDGLSFGQMMGFLGLVVASGGVGGAAYYATDRFRHVRGWRRTVANVVSLLVYCSAAVGLLLLTFGLD